MENAAIGSGITVREALQRIEAALSDYCHQAESLHEGSPFEVQVPGGGVLDGLRFEGCELHADLEGVENPAVSLAVNLQGAEVARISYSGDTTDFLGFLKQAGIAVTSSRVLGAQEQGRVAEIELQPKVQSELVFSQAGIGGLIKLLLRNHETLGESQYLIKPHQVGTEFLEQLHCFLARTPNHFLEELARKMTAVEELEEATVQADLEDLAELSKAAEVLSFQEHVESAKGQVEVIELCFRDLSMRFDRNHPVCHMGRKFPADILIRSKYVSRDHATLVYDNGEFILHDHSSNGSYVQIGNRAVSFLHNEALVLEKSGKISLGLAFSDEPEGVIEFSITGK